MADGTRVLMAYATGHGSTREIAERIASRIGAGGCRVDIRPAAEAGDIAPYDAVVLGSPVYDQSWLPEAEAFARRNRGALAGRPVWLFSAGSLGDTHRLLGRLIKREPRGIGGVVETIRPRGYRVFAGVIDRTAWPRSARLIFRALGGRFGDCRDWPQIDAWGDSIARALGEDLRGDRPDTVQIEGDPR